MYTWVRARWVTVAVMAVLTPAAAEAFPTTGYTIWTIAGNSIACSPSTLACGDGGLATAAQLNTPAGLAFDGAGDLIIADFNDQRIRMVTPAGTISTIAGTGAPCSPATAVCGDGGPATAATLNGPAAVAVDGSGNIVFSDQVDNRIRRFAPGGTITTIAGTGAICSSPTSACGDGSAATAATLAFPNGVAVDGSGNVVFSDQSDNRIRRFAPGGTIVTIAGTGTTCSPATAACGDGGLATAANLHTPAGLAIDRSGNVVVADDLDNRIRRFAPGGAISTIAGSGTICSSPTFVCGDGGAATAANLNNPAYVTIDGHDNVVFSDTSDNRVRSFAPSGIINTIAGTGAPCATTSGPCGDGGAAGDARITFPNGVAADGSGGIVFADVGSDRIRWLAGPQAGPAGPIGPGGAAGANGTNGTNGTNGSNGANGAPGPQGPRGKAGRDAKVTCRFAKVKGKRSAICRVVFRKTTRGTRARWRLLQHGRVVARGSAPIRHHAVALGRLRGVRPGRYTLVISLRRRGHPTVTIRRPLTLRSAASGA